MPHPDIIPDRRCERCGGPLWVYPMDVLSYEIICPNCDSKGGVRRLEITTTKQIKKTGTSLCIMITRDLKELLQLKEGDLVEIRMRKIEDTTEGVSSGKDAILH